MRAAAFAALVTAVVGELSDRELALRERELDLRERELELRERELRARPLCRAERRTIACARACARLGSGRLRYRELARRPPAFLLGAEFDELARADAQELTTPRRAQPSAQLDCT